MASRRQGALLPRANSRFPPLQAGRRRHQRDIGQPFGDATIAFEFTGISNIPEGNAFLYSPSADGQRFLVNAYPADSQSSLDVLINWPASIAK